MRILATVGIFSGALTEARLFKTSEVYFPKDSSTRSVRVPVTFNGSSAEVRVTSSGPYATRSTSGSNGYIRYEGKVYWFSFLNGLDAVAALKADGNLTIDEGTAPAPVIRNPADKKKEEARRKNLSESLIRNRNEKAGITEVPATEEENEA
jgi:hypothetical protein